MDDGGVDDVGGGTEERRYYAGKLSKGWGRIKRGALVCSLILAVRLVLFIASFGYIPDHHMACHIRP